MDYVPTKITLTRNTGFDENTARRLGELAELAGITARKLASQLLAAAVAKVDASDGWWTQEETQ